MARLADEVVEILDACTVDGLTVRLPESRIERKLYLKVDAALQALGGRWDRRARAHVFEEDPAYALDHAVLTGELTDWRKESAFFETPPELAARLVAAAGVVPGMRVLEPSAGRGAIVRALPGGVVVNAYETNTRHSGALADALGDRSGNLAQRDFLTVTPDRVYDAVVMNPPFTRGADAAHILHAARFLRPGGRLAAVASAGVTFRRGRSFDALRALVGACGSIEALPDGSFAPATGVRTVLVTLRVRDTLGVAS